MASSRPGGRVAVGAAVVACAWLAVAAVAPARAACECRVAPESQSLAAADVVFAGVAVEQRFLPAPTTDAAVTTAAGDEPRPVPEAWTFLVESPVKGGARGRVEIVAGGTEAPCGYGGDFEVGVRYLVFAHRHDGELWTSVCAGTRDVDAGVRTEPGVFPPPPPPPASDSAGRNAVMILGAAAAIAAGVGAGLARRSRRQELGERM